MRYLFAAIIFCGVGVAGAQELPSANFAPVDHRRFERMTTTLPSWSRPFLRPVCRARSMPFCRIIRKIRLWLAIGFPVLTSSLLANAVMRR